MWPSHSPWLLWFRLYQLYIIKQLYLTFPLNLQARQIKRIPTTYIHKRKVASNSVTMGCNSWVQLITTGKSDSWRWLLLKILHTMIDKANMDSLPCLPKKPSLSSSRWFFNTTFIHLQSGSLRESFFGENNISCLYTVVRPNILMC